MSTQTYLIDTNVIIGLEDNHTVQPAFAALLSVAAKYKVDVIVHEVARDDIQRDKDLSRRGISLSKLEKFQLLKKVRGLERSELETRFGSLPRPNDVVDATLLDSIERGAADFLVTEDRGLHERARRASPELGRRVLFVADAVQLLKTTFEPIEAPVRYVEELSLPSQALTTVGIFEEISIAESTKDLMRLTGGRSVYSEAELSEWEATPARPVKVINYLLAAYIEPAISLDELRQMRIIPGHPPQSIFELNRTHIDILLHRMNLGFSA